MSNEETGFCLVRTNSNGRLYTENYGLISGISLDPIEKKPLYHYYPKKPVLSVGTIGCNLACTCCQNWQISRNQAPVQELTPEALVKLASQLQEESGNIGLAYTYSEPGVWFEFLQEVMPLARVVGLKNILVTNGFLNPRPWEELLTLSDAMNIDLKGFTSDFYSNCCQGSLKPILKNIQAAVGQVHLELTTLLIPGENDAPEQIEAMARWIAELDPELPWHLSRYYPNYQLELPPTSLAVMIEAQRIAKNFLRYVYLGNVGSLEETCCLNCGSVIIDRAKGKTRLNGSACGECGHDLGENFMV